jgi:hypothetical protein
MIDFLSPVADRFGIGDVIDRARRHLGAQIESNGLVRYHGLANSSTIGKLGCVISPDADDTALAWRIARPKEAGARRQQMRSTLANYRDDRGFYRTWLAPHDRYECIDPGSNPNPADATIQMHVYMMLREADPAAAADLCRALNHHILDQDLWIYYAKAPLLPFLRSAELQQQGCAIPLLTDRLGSAAPGQEIWNDVARRLVASTGPSSTPNERQSISDLLERLGRRDFAELHHNPPLLYHNDLTATISRYYWSEDFGYALWLRLFDAVRSGPAPSTNSPK